MNKRFAVIAKPRNFVALAAVSALSVLPTVQAAAIDVEDITTEIAAQAAPIAAIGAAVLLLVVGIKAFKWVRRALS